MLVQGVLKLCAFTVSGGCCCWRKWDALKPGHHCYSFHFFFFHAATLDRYHSVLVSDALPQHFQSQVSILLILLKITGEYFSYCLNPPPPNDFIMRKFLETAVPRAKPMPVDLMLVQVCSLVEQDCPNWTTKIFSETSILVVQTWAVLVLSSRPGHCTGRQSQHGDFHLTNDA